MKEELILAHNLRDKVYDRLEVMLAGACGIPSNCIHRKEAEEDEGLLLAYF